jgi:tetratricopeptide (TPR) repeat protein
MNPLRRRWDPRVVLMAAVPALVLAALGARAAAQPGPATGWRINRAIDLAEAGRHQLALARFQAVLEEHPREPQAWVRAGRTLRVLGRPSEAAVSFRRAAELDPRDENIRFELARGLLEAGLPALADQAADETLALEPDHAGAHYVKAAVAALAGDASAAAERLDRALELEPTWPDRFRADPSFDPVRNDREFLDAVLSRRVPGLFR